MKSKPTEDIDHSEALKSSVHPPIYAITDAVTFKLARLVILQDLSATKNFLQEYGLSLNEWRVLGLTYALEPATISKIRNILSMDKGQMSRVVKRLSDDGFLSTSPLAEDTRSVELRLTYAGARLQAQVLNFISVRNAIVTSSLTKQECDEFIRILEKLIEHNTELYASSRK